MSFSNNNKLSFIDSLVKNFDKDDFKYSSQEFDNNVLDLVKQKSFIPYKYMSDFEKFKEEFHCEENFYSSLTGKTFSEKNMKIFLRFRTNLI